jgi:L-fucose isomerase-like protein
VRKLELKIALIPLVRSTYDVEEGKKVFQRELSLLKRFKDVHWFAPSQVIEYAESMTNFLSTLKKESIDGIVLLSATFHLGDLAMSIASNFENVPILCWAVPEPDYRGSRVRLNSLVGAHLDFSNLYRSKRTNLRFIYGTAEDERFIKKLSLWLNAIRAFKLWRESKITLIGGHAKSFMNIDVYEPELFKEFKIIVDVLPLETVFKHNPSEEEVQKIEEDYKNIYRYDENMDDDRLERVARLAATLQNIAQTTKSSALCIRCWPEFAMYYGVSPCAAMSYNMAKGSIMACEGDILGAVTMITLKAFGCEEMYLSDISQIFEEENALLFWHCGVAPHTLWDGRSERTLDTYFAGGKGVTVGFVLKPGLVTIARIDYTEGWSLFLAKGEAIETEKLLKGTYVKVKVKNAIELVESLVENGFAHHVVMAYGDWYEDFLELASMKGWKVYAEV